MLNVRIRETTVADLLDILSMIQELADYELMPDGPKLSIKNLIDDGAFYTSSTPLFHSFVAEMDVETNDDTTCNQNNLPTSPSSAEIEKDGGRPLTR